VIVGIRTLRQCLAKSRPERVTIVVNVAERQHISRNSALVELVSKALVRIRARCVGERAEGNAYMIAQASLPALYLPPRPAGFTTRCWQSIALVAVQHRNLAFPLKFGASALAWVLVTSGITEEPVVDRERVKLEMNQLATVLNETVVYRSAPPTQPDADQGYPHLYTEQIEASDQLEEDVAPSNFPRNVQVVRFVNPEALAGDDKTTAAPRESLQEGLIKIGGFVAFRPREDAELADEKEPTLPCKRPGSNMDQVDDYLWEVYQRVPSKKDGTGDFTWKDPAAAKHMGLCLQDYVIGGMDPEFREQLYHAGRAMDAVGLQWSMLSAFRDDYRQGLASGYKAGVSNSLHGGSRRTGGYGHGRAIDITGPEGRESEVWKWIDDHGAKYGLHRPLPKADPAHVQQQGDWHKIALALRESRTGSTVSDKATVAATTGKTKAAGTAVKAKVRKTAVAAAR
jgi:hypothetical protein